MFLDETESNFLWLYGSTKLSIKEDWCERHLSSQTKQAFLWQYFTHSWLYLLNHYIKPIACQRCDNCEQRDFEVHLSFYIQCMALCDLNTLWSCQWNERLYGSLETLERSVGGIDFEHSQSRQWPAWKSAARRWRETAGERQRRRGMDHGGDDRKMTEE